MKTWHKEALIVAIILALVAGKKPLEWLGSLAVLLTFMHAQIGFRLQEAEAQRIPTQVHVACWWKLQYYFVAKELCWFLYFGLMGAWSALVGVVVFLVYPVWRRYHLRPTPCKMCNNTLSDLENGICMHGCDFGKAEADSE